MNLKLTTYNARKFLNLVKNSLIHGRRAGIQASFGISAANLCHVAINLLGIGIIIAKSVMLFTVMKILGASYLIYLGFTKITNDVILSQM